MALSTAASALSSMGILTDDMTIGMRFTPQSCNKTWPAATAAGLKSYFKNPEYEVGSVDSGARICIIVGSEDEI